MRQPVTIRRYLDVEPTPERAREIDRIFFKSSNTKSFENDAARTAFRERWLGRYLKHDPAFAYVAQAADGAIVGYLVGAIEDPAKAERFADIAYFAAFGELTERFPAHLHVNIDPAFRNRRIGSSLIDRFAEDAKAAGARGVHVVTGAGAENIGFYNRNEFAEIARAGADGRLVFLARSL